MAAAGAAARDALDAALDACRPGSTTADVARAARLVIERCGGVPLFEGYPAGADRPFPDVACVCVNDEVVHGVPGERRLCAGDLVTVDVGVGLGGWCGDVADSIVVPGEEAPGRAGAGGGGGVALEVAEGVRAVVRAAVGQIGPGAWWSSAVEAGAAAAGGFAFVPGYVGHAIGRQLHEPLRVLFVTEDGRPIRPGGRHDFRLWPGMCFTIEPILATGFGGLGAPETAVDSDGWTVRLAGGGLAAQAEEVVAVTAGGCRVLTARRDGGLSRSHAGESRASGTVDHGL